MAEINDLSVTDASNTARFPENQLPSTVNDGARALEGLVARWHKDTNGTLAATGSSNSWTITPNRTISSLYDGLTFLIEAPSSVTSSATGFAGLRVLVSGSTAAGYKSAFFGSTVAVQTGDIRARQRVGLTYDSSAGNFKIWSGGRTARYATNTQVNTGTATELAVTPAGLFQSINGMTAATSIVTTGLVPFYLPTSSAPRKITYLNFINSFNGLTESTSPALSSDFLLMYSAGSSAARKVKPANVAAIAATQAQMEAGTATNVYVSPGRTQHHPGVAKAWAIFVPRTVTGSCTIDAGHNVASITRNAFSTPSTRYTVTFTTAMSGTSYVVAGLVKSGSIVSLIIQPTSLSTGSFDIAFVNTATGATSDTFEHAMIIAYGDQA